MIVNENDSMEQKWRALPDDSRVLKLNEPAFLEQLAEGGRIHAKDILGRNKLGLPSASTPSSTKSSLSSWWGTIAKSIQKPMIPCRDLPTSTQQARCETTVSNTPKCDRRHCVVLTNDERTVSEKSLSGSSVTMVSDNHVERVTRAMEYNSGRNKETEQTIDGNAMDVAACDIKESTDEPMLDSKKQVKLTNEHLVLSSELVEPRFPGPVVPPTLYEVPEDSSPVSSNGVAEGGKFPTKGTAEPGVDRKDFARLQKEYDATMLERNALAQENHMLKNQATVFSTEYSRIRAMGTDLKEQVEFIRHAVYRKEQEFNGQITELAKLIMKDRELQSSTRASLLAERDIYVNRWARAFKERRKLFNAIQELRGNIRVFCRVRPLKQDNLVSSAVKFPDAVVDGHGAVHVANKAFEFDHVFPPASSQKDVYSETAGVVASVLDGYNVCVFAYGQTGSGKTHTMNGTSEDPGVNVRALEDLFENANRRKEHSDVRISVSMLEVYNEILRDLIRTEKAENAPKLEIRKDTSSSSATAVHVPNLTTVPVNSLEDIWEIMERGSLNRSNGRTNMNEHSSRSHLILRITVKCEDRTSREETCGVLHLVDLAGSERVGRSNVSGDRLKETQHINKSLATLGNVFTALTSNQSHIPYRNSRLTYLLQDCLGGDSKTLMFVNVSCDDSDVSETTSSLQFAQRVAKVELRRAKRHVDNKAEKRWKAALREKDVEVTGLHANLSSAEWDLRKHDDDLSHMRAKLKALEAELDMTKTQLDEQVKKKVDKQSIEKELRAQHELEIGNSREEPVRVKALVAARDAEIVDLVATIAATSTKEQTTVPTQLEASSKEVASSDTGTNGQEHAASPEALNRLMSVPTVCSTDLPRRTERPSDMQVQRSNTIMAWSATGRSDALEAQADMEEKKGKNQAGMRTRSPLIGVARRVKDSVKTSMMPQSSLLSRATGMSTHSRQTSASPVSASGASAARKSYAFPSRVDTPPSTGSSAYAGEGRSSAGAQRLSGSGFGASPQANATRKSRALHTQPAAVRPPQRNQDVAGTVHGSTGVAPSGLRPSALRRAGTLTNVSRPGSSSGCAAPKR